AENMRLQPIWQMGRREVYDAFYDTEYEMPQRITEGVFTRAVYSKKQLFERMIDFWRDHFSISDEIDYPIELLLFEKNVLAKHALGNFRDLLIAASRHPAMLVYLDNFVSDKQAPNENFARELLELHTLGVDGDYSEADIREIARAFTGWTIHTGTRDGFFFDEEMHDSDEKMILGKRFPAGRGIEEGLHILSMLARHPDTARFMSTKLCTRFVADRPPLSIIESTTQVWLDTDGDIKSILRHIFRSAEFYAAAGKKYMRPFEYVVAMFRATGNRVYNWYALEEMLLRLGQYPHGWHPPNGYPDVAGAWINTGGLLNRWNAAMTITHETHEDVYSSWGILSRLLDGLNEPQTAGELVDQIATRLWGKPISGPARTQFVNYVADGAGENVPMTPRLFSQKMASTYGLMLASPTFQWR
ncbi:MAG: DUF1800 domain-containing protein, partial [Chloroflexota bacterium]